MSVSTIPNASLLLFDRTKFNDTCVKQTWKMAQEDDAFENSGKKKKGISVIDESHEKTKIPFFMPLFRGHPT